MERWVSHVAGDEHRRRIASAMLEKDGLITVDDLTRLLADRDADRETVRLNLYHRHLPKLAEAGVVDYDWRSGDVVLTVDEEQLRDVLTLFEEDDTTQLLRAA
jgi:DNA-binding transcriptional ArsR family regulator